MERSATNGQVVTDNQADDQSDTLDIPPTKDGCLILGDDAGRGNRYLTRFRFDRRKQTQVSHEGMCMEEYFPCCLQGKNSTCGKVLWNILRAESFILTLHMTVLILGVLKEALNLRTVDEELHLIHSIMETLVATLVVAVRIAGTHHGYVELIALRKKHEVVGEERVVQRRSLYKAVWSFIGFAFLMAVADWAAFFVFKFVPGAHLGWTILSNNAVLLFVTVSSNQVLGRIAKESSQIAEDHHKAVIYEAVLLLNESVYASDEAGRQDIAKRIDRFCKALRDTDRFKQPEYILCPKEDAPHWDAITSMEMLSMV